MLENGTISSHVPSAHSAQNALYLVTGGNNTPGFESNKILLMNTSISQKVIPNRMVIFAKDVMNITGRRESAARELLRRIRKAYKKHPKHFVTVSEFCTYTGLDEEKVSHFLF